MAKKSIAVVGIGRVGLPLALVLAEKYKVFGIGRTESTIDFIKKGRLPFKEEGASRLKQYINKSFFPTTSYEVIKNTNTIIITLGTPIDENMNPVLSQIDEALDTMIPYLQKNQLIILRSTVSPNTTLYVKDKIEGQTTFIVGKNLFLASCPERIAEGSAIKEILEIPQIIGGIDSKSAQLAQDVFESIGIMCLLTDSLSAELAKLFTNMYRYINFAIANEFMYIAENFNRNIHDIVSLVNTGYKRGGLAIPGLTAGPCLFKDGFFLLDDNPYLELITASWRINETVPLFIVKKLKEKTNLKGKKVAILGMAFKPEIDDVRDSLSFKIRKALLREHAKVILHDPYVANYARHEFSKSLQDAVKGVDVVVLAVNHKAYIKDKLKVLRLLKNNAYVCDIWNMYGRNKLLFLKNEK